ncbi:hypothetical protein [Glycomyces salinus]|uniref:hypothetical protein n=1 Tax=Glycomyces salinus TaxID=980294 RepID=UPI0018EC91D5|nr:hypothetical protein [Glycomyces salinus]
MSEHYNAVEVRLDLIGGDPEEVETALQYLIDDLTYYGIERVARPAPASAPAGTRSAGSVEVGALLLLLGTMTVRELIRLLRDWLGRRRSGRIHLKIGDDEMILDAVSEKMQQEVSEAFIRRHEQ